MQAFLQIYCGFSVVGMVEMLSHSCESLLVAGLQLMKDEAPASAESPPFLGPYVGISIMYTFISSDIIYQRGNTLLETSSTIHRNCGIYYRTNDPNGNAPLRPPQHQL